MGADAEGDIAAAVSRPDDSGAAAHKDPLPADGMQLSLFMSSADAGIIERIRDLDIMDITPGQAIDILTELQKELNG